MEQNFQVSSTPDKDRTRCISANGGFSGHELHVGPHWVLRLRRVHHRTLQAARNCSLRQSLCAEDARGKAAFGLYADLLPQLHRRSKHELFRGRPSIWIKEVFLTHIRTAIKSASPLRWFITIHFQLMHYKVHHFSQWNTKSV